MPYHILVIDKVPQELENTMRRVYRQWKILRASAVALAGNHSLTIASPPPYSNEPFDEKDWNLFNAIVEVLTEAGVNVMPLINYNDEWSLKNAICNDIVCHVHKWHNDLMPDFEWDVEEVLKSSWPPLPAGTHDWQIHEYAEDLLRMYCRHFVLDPSEYFCIIRVARTIAGMRVARYPEESQMVTALDMGESIEYQYPKIELKEMHSYLRVRQRMNTGRCK